jgi:phosphatidylglycerophosphate synthase
MSKLSKEEKFLDFSDYGRSIAKLIVYHLKDTRFTPVDLTLLFGVSGLISIYCIAQGWYLAAGFFIILKSILDAADGELSRAKNTPSYTGRYLDSIFDWILNFLILLSIGLISETSFSLIMIAFFCMQLQGTFYNFYYVVLRHASEGGDRTSNIIETESPKALAGEKQDTVDFFFKVFSLLYGFFDKTVYVIEKDAILTKPFPKWFMSMVSLFGLGFQLLLISTMLAMGYIDYIIIFMIAYSVLIFPILTIRKLFLNEEIEPILEKNQLD